MSAGYGREVWATDSIVTGRFVTGPMIVAQALYRRLITSQGQLRGGDEESTYGFDLAAYVGSVSTEVALLALPGLITAQFMLDDRVASVLVTPTSTNANGIVTINLEIDVMLVDDDAELSLTVETSQGSTTLIQAAA